MIIGKALELAFGKREVQLQLLNALEDECRECGHHLVVYRMSRDEMLQHMIDEERRLHGRKQRIRKDKGYVVQQFDSSAACTKFVGHSRGWGHYCLTQSTHNATCVEPKSCVCVDLETWV